MSFYKTGLNIQQLYICPTWILYYLDNIQSTSWEQRSPIYMLQKHCKPGECCSFEKKYGPLIM
jgi:hypothetical protein